MQLRKFTLCKLLWLLTILLGQPVLAYEPASFVNDDTQKTKKYMMDTIDSNFYCDYWMPAMAKSYSGLDPSGTDKPSDDAKAIVRESFAPSAMVDTNGNLYTISLCNFNDKSGPCFNIQRYYKNSTFIDKVCFSFCPWGKIPGVIPNCKEIPRFDFNANVDNEKNMFKNYIHNAFMPCLAQEVNDSSEYIYGFVYIPTTRLMYAELTGDCSGAENGATEGMLFFKLKKDDLTGLKTTYTPHTAKPTSGINDRRVFQYNYLRPRAISNSCQPQWGNFTACYNKSTKKIYLWHIADNGNGGENLELYRSTFSTDGAFEDLVEVEGGCWNHFLIPKIVRSGDCIYYVSVFNGYRPWLFVQSIEDDSKYSKKVKRMHAFECVDITTYPWSSGCYGLDFLVLDTIKNKKVWCVLGFQGSNDKMTSASLPVGKNGDPMDYDYLLKWHLNPEQGWSNEDNATTVDKNEKYLNFDPKKTSLILWSSTLISNSPAYTDVTQKYTEYIPNIIYSTDIVSGNAVAAVNKTAGKDRRLYLNTQKVCTYKNYIIYAYCYPGKPGKGNHLYIGYAPYVITSDGRVRLLTKTEFKDKDDNSFITDCSRIISLDCKNGHVWLTYMNSDNTAYKYFYIEASDLVGE